MTHSVMRWTRDGRCHPDQMEGIEGVLAILAQSTVRTLERHTRDPSERRRFAMQLASSVLDGLDAVEGNHRRGTGGLRLDRARCEVLTNNAAVQLTPAGAAALALLLETEGQVVSVEAIAAVVGPVRQRVRSTPVDVQQVMHRLRKTLGRTGERIVCVRGLGYVLTTGDEDDRVMAAGHGRDSRR